MTKTEAEILFVIFIIVFVILLVWVVLWWIDLACEFLDGEHRRDLCWVQNAPVTTIVNEAILSCNDILYNLDIDHFPSYRIYYYKHQKYFGVFDGEVVIYTKNHQNVVELIDTVLHEVKHFIQSEVDDDFKNYETYTKQYGIWDNPFEVDARQFAKENLNECLLYLEGKGLVIRG